MLRIRKHRRNKRPVVKYIGLVVQTIVHQLLEAGRSEAAARLLAWACTENTVAECPASDDPLKMNSVTLQTISKATRQRKTASIFEPPSESAMRWTALVSAPGVNAIAERFEGDAAADDPTFDPLVPVQADLHRIRKAGTELDTQRAEVAIDPVEFVTFGLARGSQADLGSAAPNLPFFGFGCSADRSQSFT